MLDKPRNRKVAAALAFAGAFVGFVAPTGAGLHKFYVGQPLWGILYLLLSPTPIPSIASAIEGIWYLTQDSDEFDSNFNDDIASTVKMAVKAVSASNRVDPEQISAVAEAVRQLDELRADGLLSEYEFEQKRRQLLDRIA